MPAKNINRLSTQNVLPTAPTEKTNTRTYGEIFDDIGDSLKDLILSDVLLMMSELKQIQQKLGGEVKKIISYGTLLALSSLPLVVFAIIGLGILMNGRYWLSSLIVGLVFFVFGGLGFLSACKRLKKIDMDLPKTKSALREEGRILSKELNKVRMTVKGEGNELH